MDIIQKVALAPMEGVMDAHMRRLITAYGGVDYCVCEFIRVNHQLLPKHVFHKICPELLEGGQVNNVPVHVQLLGQSPHFMAENAHRAAQLGAPAIDLNFGCPAKTVNKSKGGAVLLKEPQTIYEIVKTVRNAVDSHIPISAKMRLGFEDTSLVFENAKAIEEAGAAWITVHGRTKRQAYTGQANWPMIGEIRKYSQIPIIANGDIIDRESAIHCAKQTGCSQLMVGRGALSLPNLAAVIKGEPKLSWEELLMQLYAYEDHMNDKKYYPARLKQWLRYLQIQYIEAENLFEEIKRITNAYEIKSKIEQRISE